MKIRYDFEYLVHLLYCAVHNTQPQEKPEGISFENVFAIGKAHEVANIAYLSVEKLNQKPDAELLNEWQVFYYHSVQRDARQRMEYAALTELLTQNKIRWTEAQGTITKKLYPFTDWRMMSDIDLICDAEKMPLIESLIPALGEAQVEHIHENELNVFPAHGSEIEFHSEFFCEFYEGSQERYAGAINSPFEHAAPAADNPYHYVLDTTHYYLYSLLHTIKHYEYAGCGIRRILDLYYLQKAYGELIDADYVQSVLDKFDFSDYAKQLFQLERYWFEDEMPTDDIVEMLLDVVCSGNHGAADIKLRNELRRDAAGKGVDMKAAKRRRFWQFLFPTREEMYSTHPDFAEKEYSMLKCYVLRAAKNLNPGQIKKMFQFFDRVRKTDKR